MTIGVCVAWATSSACGGDDAAGRDASGDMDAAPLDGAADGSPRDGESIDAGPPPPSRIMGELSFAGCTPSPASVTVRLGALEASLLEETMPIIGGAPPAAGPGVDEEEVPDIARVTATADPHVLAFELDGLPTGALYQVGVTVDDPDCVRLTWRGPPHGLVTAGAEMARFDAVSLHTQVEVQATRGRTVVWRNADYLREGAMTRHFRVRTDVADAESVELQVTSEKFRTEDLAGGDYCATSPRALVATSRATVVPGSGGWVEVDVDMSPALADLPRTATEADRVHRAELLSGAPLYVRAVPVKAAERACDPRMYGASSWVRLSYLPGVDAGDLDPSPSTVATGSRYLGQYPFPSVLSSNWSCFRVIVPHRLPITYSVLDGLGTQLVMRHIFDWNELLLPGTGFCLAPSHHHSSFLEDIGDAFGAFVEAVADPIEWAVNHISALYEEIKAKVVELAAYAISTIVSCDASCKALLALGLELALSSMGLPPSLPDFDQLVDEGVDYLAAEIAAQTGVPPEVIEQAVMIAERAIAKAKQSRGLSYAPWALPDDEFRATVLHLEVSRSASGTPQPWIMVTPQPADRWIGASMKAHVPPAGAPALRVPVVLRPVTAGLPPLPPLLVGPGGVEYYGGPERAAAWFETRWAEQLPTFSCAGFDIWGGLRVPFPLPVERIASPTIHNYQDAAFTDPFEMQCSL